MGEICGSLNKIKGCSSSTLIERESVNKVIHLLTNVLSRAYASFSYISNTSKIEVARTSLICTYHLNHSLFGYAKNCMS